MNPADFDITGHIGQLYIYPVKSCAGIAVASTALLPTGLAHDRAFMLVDAQGRFISQREIARMALIQPSIDTAAGLMHLAAPGMPSLAVALTFDGPARNAQVWADTVPALAAPAEVNHWFSTFLGADCTLVRMAPTARRLASRKWTGDTEAPTQFADGYPVLVISQAAVDTLNARLAQAGLAQVEAERFRANIIIDGFEAHDEDRIDALTVQTAQEAIRLPIVKPCARCPIPDIDQRTAESDTRVSDTLRAYRRDKRLNDAVTFGMNAIVTEPGTLCVGDAVGGMLEFD